MNPPTLPENIVDNLNHIYVKRWQSLLAVDELVKALVDTLVKTKQIDNTFIIFTSDNGYHMGQFAQAIDKRQPYETDIRVPFIVRGPNVNPKSLTDLPVALIDLVPTILELAGTCFFFLNKFPILHISLIAFYFNLYLEIKPPIELDGLSFATSLTNQNNVETSDSEQYERQILIEYWGEGNLETYSKQCPWRKSDKLFVSR